MDEAKNELEKQEPERFEKSPVLTQDGWLTRAGIFYKSDHTQHDELATYCAQKLGYDIDEIIRKGKSPRQILQEEGYVLMSQGTPIIPEEDLSRAQIEAFNKSNVLIPSKETEIEEHRVRHFTEAYKGELTTEEKNVITALTSNKDKSVSIWDNQKLSMQILRKITRNMESGERIELTEYHGASSGSYFQYWIDKPGGIALTHYYHIHAGDSAHYYDAPRVDETIRIRTPDEARKDFEFEKSFWKDKSKISKPKIAAED